MDCRYNMYHCLCAYLLDGEPDREQLRSIMGNPDLCPKCRACTESERNKQLELQRSVRSLVQRQLLNMTAPSSLRTRIEIELSKAEEYRESGIQVLGLIQWGTHIAQLYNTRDDLAELLVPYIGSGLENDELCIFVTSTLSEQEARSVLEEGIPYLHEYVNTGQLQFFSYEDWSVTEAHLDSQCALGDCFEECQNLPYKDYSGLRIAGSASWLGQSGWESLMQYENLLNDTMCNHRVLALCTYDGNRCTTDNITDIINTHSYVISRVDESWSLLRSVEL